MMPLILSKSGEETTILRVGGTPEVRQHLNDLGFVAGTSVTVLNVIAGNLIVKVKESRVAISREMAQKIMVQ
jgi:ferrous iron transport protein A